MLQPRITFREAINDPALLGHALAGDTWLKWRALLLAAMGESLTDDERAVFQQLTGRDHEPNYLVEEFVCVKGRRAGGSSATGRALIPYLAGLCEHPSLSRGERGILLCVAADQRQADVILNYCEASFRDSPILSQLIESRTARELRLTNNITIEVRAADFKRLRGLTFIGAICDELAFFETSEESANPDVAILDAIRPGLASTGGPLFLISSPYARRGVLWQTYKQHFGANGHPLILVAQGSSRTFNSTLPQSVIDRAFERDPLSAAAEYGAEFRQDLEEFVSLESVLACVDKDVRERPKEHYKTYEAFTDPSGGSSDSFTLAIGHKDLATKVLIIDAIREAKPPFSPEAVVAEFARLLKSYGVSKVRGDKYAGEFPKELFGKHGIRYEQSAKPKSELYLDTLAAINSKRVALLDNARLISQLVGLERRTSRSGRDSIDHSPGAKDDVANAVAGLCAGVINKYPGYDVTYRAFQPGFVDEDIKKSAPQDPAPQPVQCNGNWWMSQPQYQQPSQATYIESADENLRRMYKALNGFR
jgi:hypothetical protein